MPAVTDVCAHCKLRAKFVLLLIACMPSPVGSAEFQIIAPEAVAATSPFQWHNPDVRVTAVSGDGTTIAGQIRTTGVIYDCAVNECGVGPFVWDLRNGSAPSHVIEPTPLNFGSHTMGAIPRHATSLSHDGEDLLVVSEYRHYEAAIYRSGQPNLLRPMIEPAEHLWGASISAEGSVVIGNIGDKPFHWDEEEGLNLITGLPDNKPFTATAVSGNGEQVLLNVQAGVTHGIFGLFAKWEPSNARQWSKATGHVELLPLSHDDYSRAAASSFSGATVVGGSVQVTPENSHITRAVRWVTGIASQLELVAGYDSSMAHDVSRDGATVVGNVYHHGARPYWYVNPEVDAADFSSRAVLWNSAGDVFDLKTLLITKYGLGAQLEGWVLTDANLISESGNLIAGYGIGPDGKGAAWVAILGIPEPSAAVLVTTALVWLSARRAKSGCRARE